jgi:hypothetical protein
MLEYVSLHDLLDAYTATERRLIRDSIDKRHTYGDTEMAFLSIKHFMDAVVMNNLGIREYEEVQNLAKHSILVHIDEGGV